MTHPVDVVAQALELSEIGRSATEIARELGVPRTTVRDWMRGRAPRRSSVNGGCRVCGEVQDFGSLPSAYVQLLGLYLGDGCLAAHPRGVFRLRISRDARYPGIVSECEDAMRQVLPRSRVNRVGRGTWYEVYSYSRQWPCLFPQHGPGRKHERPIALTTWQWRLVSRHPERLLRGLLHSDGCRFQNTGRGWSHPRYAFSNASGDIQAIFCAACELLGLHWTVSGDRIIYVSRKADVAALDVFVGPKA